MIISNGSIRHTATCVGAQRGESFALFPSFKALKSFIPRGFCQIDSEAGTGERMCRAIPYDWSMIFKGPIK